ncbi:MAG: hypothetical protein AAF549_00265 [Pseudomonadota bacterium]
MARQRRKSKSSGGGSGWLAGGLFVIAGGILAVINGNNEEDVTPTTPDFPNANIIVDEFQARGDVNLIIRDPFFVEYTRFKPRDNREDNPFATRRSSVTLSDARFDPIGRMLIDFPDGSSRGICTVAAVNRVHHDTTEPGVLVDTAAHCILNENYQIRENIRVAFNYVTNDGLIGRVVLGHPQIWFDSDYTQEVHARQSGSPHDKALLFFPGVELPEEIRVIDANIDNNLRQLAAMQSNAILAGYGSDLFGMNRSDCRINSVQNVSLIDTNCSAFFGNSGGPLLLEDRNGNLETLGVTSAAHVWGGRYTNFAAFTRQDFEDSMPAFFQAPTCATVTLDRDIGRSAVRAQPDVSGTIIAAVEFGDVARIDPHFDDSDEWVELRDGGFVSATHVELGRCPP